MELSEACIVAKRAWIGRKGTIPPTGKAVWVPFVVTQKVTGGKVSSFHLYFDRMELMTQLGLM